PPERVRVTHVRDQLEARDRGHARGEAARVLEVEQEVVRVAVQRLVRPDVAVLLARREHRSEADRGDKPAVEAHHSPYLRCLRGTKLNARDTRMLCTVLFASGMLGLGCGIVRSM